MPIAGELDGRGRIYAESGEIILIPGEQILASSSNEPIYVRKLSGGRKTRLMETTNELSTLYVTNKRIVYIRTPEPFLAAKRSINPLGLGDAAYKALRARELRKIGAYEYLEVNYEDVETFSIKRGKYATLLVQVDGDTFEVEFDRRGKADTKLEVMRQQWREIHHLSPTRSQMPLADYK